MADIGFHLGSETTELINPHMQREFPNDSTKYITSTWERIKLLFDDIEVVKTFKKGNSYGVYVANGVLYIDGDPIAKDSNLIDFSEFGLRVDGIDVYFGKVKLTSTEGEVINITKEDYCTLLAGGVADGYTIFNPENVYNIVEDVASAPTITWNNPDHLKYVIYNNIVGIKDRQSNDIVHSFTDQHFLSTDTPQLSVHDYKFRILKGEHLKFMVMVDTKRLDKLLNNRLDDTFTIIVRNPYDKVLFCRTVYAGEIYVELSSFIDDNDELYSGQTWFSVECIDNHGRGSAVRYYDLLILEDVPDVVYNVTINDLEAFDIQANNRNEMVAYKNKLGFTNLFKHFANLGKTKLVLPKNIEDENEEDRYSELDEPTPNTDIYYINYHALIDDTPGASKPFGDYEFWLYVIPPGTTNIVNPNTNVQKIKLIIGLHVNYPVGSAVFDGEEIVDDPLEFVKRDGAHLYRVTDDDIAAHNTNSTKITIYNAEYKILGNNDKDKIWVRWRNEFIYDQTRNGRTLWDITNENPNDRLHLQYLSAYDPSTMQYVGDTGKKPLRTYNIDKLPTYTDKNTGIVYYTAGSYYVVKRTSRYGDSIEFPDNITIDFNGATLKGIRCQDENDNDLHYFDLTQGHIVCLDENYNTHLKNLKVEGIMYEFDWVGSYLITGRNNGGVCESVNNIGTDGSKFCSYENVESSYALCYEAMNRAKTAGNRRYPDGQFLIPSGCTSIFGKLGYINFNGEIVSYTTPIRTLNPGSAYGDCESLVYDETYRTCNVVYDYTRKKDSHGNTIQVQSDDFTIGAYVYPNGNGKHPEAFIAFYKLINNDVNNPQNVQFIKLIKTKTWTRVKVPRDATHYRVVGYGISKIDTNTGERISSVIISSKSHKEFRGKANAAFPGVDLGDWTYTEHSRCILYKNCYTHDTRSSGFSCETVNGVVYDGCVYKDISFIPSSDWNITKELGGFEDGGYKTNCVTIKNCRVVQTREGISFEHIMFNYLGSPTNKLRYSENVFSPLRCRDFTIMNTEGYSMGTTAAIFDGYIVNNTFCDYTPMRDYPVPYRHMIYRNNIIYRRLLIRRYQKPTFIDPPNPNPENLKDDNNKGYRQYNCDDVPSYTIVMTDSFIAKTETVNSSIGPYYYNRRYIRTKVVDSTPQ